MRIREVGEWFVVEVAPNELEITATRRLPFLADIGGINHRGTIRVWRPHGSLPRNYNLVARYALERARDELWNTGRLRNRPAERARKKEEKTGGFIVRLDTGRSSRFHGMASAHKWTEAELAATRARRAEFYHAKGPYETLPFSAWEKRNGSNFVHGAHLEGAPGSATRRGYDARRYAESAPASEQADAWQVAADAFREVPNPFQEAYATEQEVRTWAGRNRDPRRTRQR